MDRTPGLATILVGDDPASAVYVRMKREDSAEVGIESFHHEPGGDVAPEELAELIRSLNADERVDGILLQLPLPDHLDQDEFISLIDPAKDVDGLTTANAGLLMHGREEAIVPCTPAGVMRLLDEAGRGAVRRAARWCSAARSSWASRWRSCCWARTPPSPTATRARATWRPCAGRRTCWWRRWARRARDRRHGGRGRGGDRRGHEPHRRRASWATWTSRPRRSAPGRSRRCRAAWAR